MIRSKPRSGQPAVPLLTDIPMWSDLFDIMAWWKNGGDRGPASSGGTFLGGSIAISSEDSFIDAGEIRQLKTLESKTGATESSLMDVISNSPMFTVEDPVWHTAIDNLVVIHKPIPVNSIGPARSPRLVAVPITAKPDDDTWKWVMVDPTTPKRLKPCKTSGIYKMIGWYDLSAQTGPPDNIAIIDTQEDQTWWMYELTEDSQAPATTKAKLLDLEETEFAAEIDLSDPQGLMDDQESGDKGYCIHLGNEFLAMQAVCKE